MFLFFSFFPRISYKNMLFRTVPSCNTSIRGSEWQEPFSKRLFAILKIENMNSHNNAFTSYKHIAFLIKMQASNNYICLYMIFAASS